MPIQAGLDDPVTDLTQVVTADLDGDGCLEVIAQRYNAWGVEYNVYKLAGDQLVRVASYDLGVG